MVQGKVEICGVNTSKLPILKEEEKEELFQRIKAGDMEAREKYIQGNLRLVLSVIKRFSNSNECPDDLFQIVCIGLIKAIDNFKPEMMVKFSTYVIASICSSISAILFASRLNGVSSTSAGTAYELDAIAAVIIGGTAMSGGKGSIWGTLAGIFILGIVSNILDMWGVSVNLQGAVKGLVIIIAVLIQKKERN